RFAQSIVKEAPRIRAVIEETMRLTPPIDATTRVMQEDLPITDTDERGCPVTGGTFADPNNAGRVLPKGALVMSLCRAMGHDKRVFGDDAEEFKHERWTKTKGDKLAFDHRGTPVRFFGFGMRQCIGRRIATTEVQVVLGFLLVELEEIKLLHKEGVNYFPKVRLH
ncbi:MAG: hypothetical protein MHM6MM_009629, partial [Cercozoa sp. M6MM]